MSPGRFDAALIRRHLLALDGALRNLRRHTGRPLAALLEDPDEEWTVERGLQLCAQNSLDIATHLAVSGGHDTPDYATAIDLLGTMGVLPTSFATQFRGIAGFRNLVVHGYLEIDPNRIHLLLNQRLDDFVEFAKYVEAYLHAT